MFSFMFVGLFTGGGPHRALAPVLPPPAPYIFKLVQHGPYHTGTPFDMFKLIHYVARATVRKQVVGIQLKCSHVGCNSSCLLLRDGESE